MGAMKLHVKLCQHFFCIQSERCTVIVYCWWCLPVERKGEVLCLIRRRSPASIFNTHQRLEYIQKFKAVNEQSEKAVTLRSMFAFKNNRLSISIDEVEPAENL